MPAFERHSWNIPCRSIRRILAFCAFRLSPPQLADLASKRRRKVLKEAPMLEPAIRDVAIKELVRHCDERGFFLELVRRNDGFFAEGFGQWSMSRMHPGVVKAWHYHMRQVDWWFVPRGNLKAVLHDRRDDSETKGVTQEFLMGDAYAPYVLRIPPGVLHGCKVIGGETDLMYVASAIYDGSDEFRVPHDDPAIGYDWLKGAEIK